ncbi:MAG: propeptide PepSY amd peptidase [Cytophagaceae bacterium]|nr:propeptide PepSY amd peptidase [Cytophagaceae bacterium]
MKLKFPPFKPINAWLHLWLGLASGIVVVVVSITGCILAFEQEIKSITEPYQYTEYVTGKAYLPPSVLIDAAKAELKGKKVTGIMYPEPGKSVVVSSFTRKPKRSFTQVYLDPYSGKVLYVKAEGGDFFRFILEGHFNLWLPRDIGQPIVSYATVIFVVLLITGLVLWWPKNWKKSNQDKSFKIKWSAKWKRVNYDLHNVPGFYAMVIALMIALTGMTFGLQWFTDGLYWGFSGGKSEVHAKAPLSDTTVLVSTFVPVNHIDQIWWNEFKVKPENASMSMSLPSKAASDIISTTINYRPGTFYNTKNRYFDQYSGKEFSGKTLFEGHAEEMRLHRQIHLYSYDIHVGGILGFPGKVLAFLASLVSASLPITGFIIWWGKKKKKGKDPKDKNKKTHKVKTQPIISKPQPVKLRRVPSIVNIE